MHPTLTATKTEAPAHSCILAGVPVAEMCDECRAKVDAVVVVYLRWLTEVATETTFVEA